MKLYKKVFIGESFSASGFLRNRLVPIRPIKLGERFHGDIDGHIMHRAGFTEEQKLVDIVSLIPVHSGNRQFWRTAAT